MPAYVRLLAYFSNFILLATFLGIGVGCLLAARRRNLFVWFPLAAVRGDRRRRSAAARGRAAEHVDDLFLQRHDRRRSCRSRARCCCRCCSSRRGAVRRPSRTAWAANCAARPPLRAYVINLLGSLAGRRRVRGGVVARAAAESSGSASPRPRRCRSSSQDRRADRPAVERRCCSPPRSSIVHRMEGGSLWSPYYRITVFQDNADTVVEVNHIFHQSMAPVAQKEYFYQWPYTVFGDTFDEVLILGAGSGTDVAAALRHGAKHVDAVDIDPVILRLGRRAPSRPAVQRSARHGRQRRRAAFPADDDEAVRPRGVRADRLADRAIELLRRAARELHVHEGVVRGGARAAVAARRDGALQLLPREVAGRSAGEHRRRGVRPRSARPRAPGSRVSRGDARRAACSRS